MFTAMKNPCDHWDGLKEWDCSQINLLRSQKKKKLNQSQFLMVKKNDVDDD
jgi:hypothetical protein